jgi:dihydrodipicolinate reductase
MIKENEQTIIIAGSGKLAQSLINGFSQTSNVIKWDNFDKSIKHKNIVIHTGSGRQLQECLDYCNESKSVLMELSTGTNIEQLHNNCPVVICPNTAIPVLKIIKLINDYGKDFSQYKVRIIESHQKEKKTVAGTAMVLAQALNVPNERIESIRDIEIQKNTLGIPEEYLNLHAYHKIIVEDIGCEIKIETKVLGHDAYVSGVKKIIDRIDKMNLKNKKYQVLEIL